MKDEAAAHMDSARRSLDAAELLLANAMHEISVGRSYYAMFHAATALILEKGIERGSHKGVVAAFGQFVVKPGEMSAALHRDLQNAFDARLEADYGPRAAITEATARQQLSKAKEFVEACQQHLK